MEKNDKGYVLPILKSPVPDEVADYYQTLQKYGFDKQIVYRINKYLTNKEIAISDTNQWAKLFSLWLPSEEIASKYQQVKIKYNSADMKLDIVNMIKAITRFPVDMRQPTYNMRIAMNYLIGKYIKDDQDAFRFVIIKHLVQEKQGKALLYLLERSIASKFDSMRQSITSVGATISLANTEGEYIFKYLKNNFKADDKDYNFLLSILQQAFQLHGLTLIQETQYQNRFSIKPSNQTHPNYLSYKMNELFEMIDSLPKNTNAVINTVSQNPVILALHGIYHLSTDPLYRQIKTILSNLTNVLSDESKKERQAF